MTRVLFLDIDGVILSGTALHATGDNRHLPPAAIALVNQVLDRTGAVVVVSSNWRMHDDCREMLAAAGLTRLHDDWATPTGRQMVGSIILGRTRGSEIQDWLDRHQETEAYAIVDDDSDMLDHQRQFFVKTQFMTGICDGHVEMLVDILGEAACAP